MSPVTKLFVQSGFLRSGLIKICCCVGSELSAVLLNGGKIEPLQSPEDRRLHEVITEVMGRFRALDLVNGDPTEFLAFVRSLSKLK